MGEITTRLGGARLLTITGPPGAGKTRIALAAVASLEADRPGHAWFVDASHIESRADLESAIGLAIGIGDAATTTEIASLASARPGVLLLDDAPSDAEQVAELVAHLASQWGFDLAIVLGML